ncbi:hypothetical protein I4U23_001432 [Adineta vaga]|nr:hypothetical protein I4U23_001432 [Adineta vaga]
MSSFRPYQWTYPQKTGTGFTILPRFPTSNTDIEQYFLQLATRLKNFDIIINHNLPFLLHGHLKESIHRVHKLQLHVIHRYINNIERFLRIINDNSNGSLNRKQRYEIERELNSVINDLTQLLENIQTKARFINDLVGQNFIYLNAGQYNFNEINDVEMLKYLLMKDYNNDRILCSNDILNSNHQSQLKILIHELVEERKRKPNLRLVYADFSNSLFKLHDFIVLPFRTNSIEKRLFVPVTNNDTVQILLLGESGIGKSTFINAFINYLTFETLERAQSKTPAVVIPVEFMITVGDHFEEHRIKFGENNDSMNEDFHHPGHSVTQRCKSYVFNLGSKDKRKLRIIDTPGFGDTRGIDQDEQNMQHILEYIHDLTHLNAVCFLLKPNVSRISSFFSSCLNQLFELMGSNFHQNIIFCFTNARSTFYTPGDTAPLLKNILHAHPVKHIPFNKENTFCFDNEAFRYLVALQNKIHFTKEEQQEYETSWLKSVQESDRLLQYIRTQLSSYPLDDTQQSIQHARIEIHQMIRPILEAMRNLLRNRILWNSSTSTRLIKLCPQVIQRSSAFCRSCKRDAFHIGHFWILPDDAHEFRNKKCLTCSCAFDQHIIIDYILGYDTMDSSLNDNQLDKINDLLEILCATSVNFALFLRDMTRSGKEDPFLIGLKRLLHEEQQICTVHHESNQYNLQLVEELKTLLISHDEQMTKLKSRDLSFIYQKIKTTKQYSTIQEQMTAIHQHRRKYKNQCYEFEIMNNSLHRKAFSFA